MATPTPLSQIDRARRATLIRYAEGADLSRASEFWGIPKPAAWPAASWRQALRAVALGARGTDANVGAFLRGVFKYLEEDVTVTLDPANPQRITATAGAGTFTQASVLRWVEINGVIYKTVGPADVSATGSGAYVELAAHSSARHAAADWSTLSSSTTATATFLAYTYVCPTPGPDVPASNGKACHVIVTLFDDAATTTPPTYIQPECNWLLYDARSAAFNLGATVTGGTSGATAKIRRIIDNTSTGALQLGDITGGPFQDNETITDDGGTPGSATSNGTVGNWLQLYDNESGTFAVGETVTGGTSGAEGVVTGLQDDGSSGILVLAGTGAVFEDNEGLTGDGTGAADADGDTDTLERPTAQPDGGHVQDDEFEEGDQTNGPYPIYMTGSTIAPAIKSTLEILLAAGCHPEIIRSSTS